MPAMIRENFLTGALNAPKISIIPIRPIKAAQLRTIISVEDPSNVSPKFDLREVSGEVNPRNIVQVKSPEMSMTHLKFDKKKCMA